MFAEGGTGPTDAANPRLDLSNEADGLGSPQPNVDSGRRPPIEIDAGRASSAIVDASGETTKLDAAAPSEKRTCRTAVSRLTRDASRKRDLVALFVDGGSALAWLTKTDEGERVTLASERAGTLSSTLSDLDLSRRFDAHLLGASGPNGPQLFISDATSVVGYDWPEVAPSEPELRFEESLPLLDARAFRTPQHTLVVGIDVAQGCGSFVRAAVATSEPVDADVGAATAMSKCLVNFLGTLKAGVVLESGTVMLLVGDRLMHFAPAELEFDERVLRGGQYTSTQDAALGWGARGGILVFAREGTMIVEHLDLDGSVRRDAALGVAASTPLELLEGDTGQWWLTSVSTIDETGAQRLSLDAFDEASFDAVAQHVVFEGQGAIGDVQSTWLRRGESLRSFWLAEVDGVDQVFGADTVCEPVTR